MPLISWYSTPAASSFSFKCCHRAGSTDERDVVQAAEHLRVLAEVEAREVEEGEQVAVADVEEEVRGTLVVAVLEQLGERELEQVLVERDRRLHVARQQREMVHATRRRRRPVLGRREVPIPELVPLGGPVDGGTVSHPATIPTVPPRVPPDALTRPPCG